MLGLGLLAKDLGLLESLGKADKDSVHCLNVFASEHMALNNLAGLFCRCECKATVFTVAKGEDLRNSKALQMSLGGRFPEDNTSQGVRRDCHCDQKRVRQLLVLESHVLLYGSLVLGLVHHRAAKVGHIMECCVCLRS